MISSPYSAEKRAKYYQRIKDNIKKHGQHVTAVACVADPASSDYSEDFQPFVYTIGNYEKGFAELLYIGNCSNTYVNIINILADIQRKRNRIFEHGEMVDYTAKFPARIIDAGQRGCDEYAFGVSKYYNTKAFEIRQILLCDQNGKYPDEVGCLYTDSIVLTQTH